MRVVQPSSDERDFVQPKPLDEILANARTARERVVAPLRDELAELDGAIEKTRAQLKQLEDERRTVAGVIDKLAPTNAKSKQRRPYTTTEGTREARSAGRRERHGRIMEWAREQTEPFTASQVVEAFALHQTTANRDVAALRDDGLLVVTRREGLTVYYQALRADNGI